MQLIQNPCRFAILLPLALMLQLNALSSLAHAQSVSQTAPAAFDAQEVSAYFDSRMPSLLNRGDVAGGVVVAVKNGAVIFAKGYGYASLSSRRRFRADRTLLRPGSITKLFTWTAVMQQVERGNLDLDRDINAYLDFRIPSAFGKPVTLRNLMTHSAGFEEVTKDLFVKTPAELYPLGIYLKRRLPDRIFPPGKVIAYSNYGAALAGYIVERITRTKFEDYVEAQILRPLIMSDTSFSQPLPANLRARMSAGYASRTDGTRQPFELIQSVPAGALTTSGMDMAKFMIAHLEGGPSGQASVLRPQTIRTMQSRQLSSAPPRNGFTLGMFENDRNGLRIVGHDGDTLWFHSDLQLIPSERIGIFISLNSAGNGLDIRQRLFRPLLDRFFPQTITARPPFVGAKSDARRVVGWYETSRRYETILGLLRSLHQVRIEAQADGTIRVPIWGDSGGRTKVWREIGPLEYQEVGGRARLSFASDANGAIRHYVNEDNSPIEVFQRVPWLQTEPALFIGRTLAAGAMILAFVGPLGFALCRRQPLAIAIACSPAHIAGNASLLLGAGMLIIWPLLSRMIAGHFDWRLTSAAEPWLYAAYGTSLIALLGIPFQLWHVHASWRSASALKRAACIAGAVGSAYFVWFVATYNLASFDVGY